MRYKLTVLLIVLNLALFSLIFYIDRVQSTRSVFESSSRLILDPSFVQGLDKIRISSKTTGTSWQLELSPDSIWNVNAPVHWKANPYAIQQLLFQLKSLSWESRFPVNDLEDAGQSLDSYNLADPPLRIELSNGETSQTLSLGAPTEIGNRLYTMSPDGEFILVISRGLMEMLQRDMGAFLDRRIFGIGMEESRVIQIQDRSASNVRVRLERGETGWRFVSPIEAAADTERVQAMIANWQSTDAEGFNSVEETALEMSNNSIQLTFEGLNSRESLTLAPPVGADNTNTYYLAKRDGFDAVFKVDASQVEELRRAQDALREKRVLHRNADDWTSMEIQFDNLSTTLQQLENGAWQVLNTDALGTLNSQAADPQAVDNIKTLLRTMEAVNFVSDAPSENDLIRFGLDDPQRQVVLRKASGESVTFQIGGITSGDEGTLLYAKTDQSASVFTVRPHILAGISLNPLAYKDRTIYTLPDTAEVVEITATIRESDIAIDLGEELENALKDYFKIIRIEKYLNQAFADPIDLGGGRSIEWPYLLSATITDTASSAESPEVMEFHLSERLGGVTQYIGDPVTGLVGTLPIDLIEGLDAVLASFPEDPGDAPAPPVLNPAPEEVEPTLETEPQA